QFRAEGEEVGPAVGEREDTVDGRRRERGLVGGLLEEQVCPAADGECGRGGRALQQEVEPLLQTVEAAPRDEPSSAGDAQGEEECDTGEPGCGEGRVDPEDEDLPGAA